MAHEGNQSLALRVRDVHLHGREQAWTLTWKPIKSCKEQSQNLHLGHVEPPIELHFNYCLMNHGLPKYIPIGEGPGPTSIKSLITFINGFDVITWCYDDRNNKIVNMLQHNIIQWRAPESLSPVGVPDGCTLIVEVNDLVSTKSIITYIIGFDVIVWCYDDRNDKFVIMLQHNIFNGESPIPFCGGSSRWMYFNYGSQWPNNKSMYITHMCCIKGMFMTMTSGHDHYFLESLEKWVRVSFHFIPSQQKKRWPSGSLHWSFRFARVVLLPKAHTIKPNHTVT